MHNKYFIIAVLWAIAFAVTAYFFFDVLDKNPPMFTMRYIAIWTGFLFLFVVQIQKIHRNFKLDREKNIDGK